MQRLILQTNTRKATVTKTGDKYQIKGFPILVDDAVMNGLHYDAEVNKMTVNSIVGHPLTLSHPKDKSGNLTSVYTPDGVDYLAGGKVVAVNNVNGVWLADAEVDVNKLTANKDKGGDSIAQALDNKKPIGVSTGLFYTPMAVNGKNKKGQAYNTRVTDSKYEHLALLDPDKETPAGGSDTMITVNSEQILICNVDDALSDISVEQESLIKRLITKVDKLINNSYNQDELNLNKGDIDMTPEEMKQAIADGVAAGFAANASNQLDAKAIGDAVATAIKPVADGLAEVQTALTANAKKETDELVDQVLALATNVLDKEQLQALPKDKLQAMLAKSGVVAANSQSGAGGRQDVDGYQPATPVFFGGDK